MTTRLRTQITRPAATRVLLACALGIALATAAPTAAAAGAPGGGPRCFGEPATIVGTGDRDVLRGTPGADVVVTFRGFDVVHGLGGADRICTGRGGDELFGEGGRDRLQGGPDGQRFDDDFITSDTLVGGPGDDVLDGGPGLDEDRPGVGDLVTYRGSPFAVRLDLGRGVARVGSSSDTLRSIEDAAGSPQPDRLVGNGRANDLFGLAGRDVVRGLGAFDRPQGGPGDDDVSGGDAYDITFGGPGDDRMDGGPGADEMYGDEGADRMAGAAGNDAVYGDTGRDVADGGPNRDRCRAERVRRCER